MASKGCTRVFSRDRPTWLLAALISLAPASGFAQPLSVSIRNQVNLGTSATDQHGQPFTVAGLSGLTYLTGNRWIAVLDNSDTLLDLSISLNPDGSIASAAITGGIRLAALHDHEDLAFTGAARNTVLVAEEDTPAIREYSLAPATLGHLLQTLTTPPVYAGRRANFGFESVSLRTPGGTLWTCNEEALTPDGPLSTPSAGTTVRLLRAAFTGGVLTPGPQFAYLTQPIHAASTSGARSGVSALVALPSGRLLALERSFGFSIFTPFQTRIYDVDTTSATDVSALPGLVGQSYAPASKTLLYTGSLTNLEGLALGPALAEVGGGGGYSLLGIIDDGDPISVNRLVAFVLTGPVAAPPCAADWDQSGSVTPADVAAFVSDWTLSLLEGTLLGDADGNGSVQPADVGAFVNSWFAALTSGC